MDSRQPAEVYPVGHYVFEECEARGWSFVSLEPKLRHWDLNRVGEVVTGHLGDASGRLNAPLTPAEAADLGQVFGTSPEFWQNLDRAWQEATPEQRRAPRDIGGREADE